MQDPAESDIDPAPGQPDFSSWFEIGSVTDIGRKRSQNQDSLAVLPGLGLFLVADGMGGHRGGEIASQMAAEIIPQAVQGSASAGAITVENARDILREAIRAANHSIYSRALQTPVLRGMGTTTTALIFRDDQLIIGHVGDSRCYLFREPNLLWQLTRDHSLVQEKLRAGLISRQEMRTDRMKNVITRSVGFEPDVNVETYGMRTQPGDCFIICSDGLSGLVNDEQMRVLLEENLILGPQSAEAAVQKLVDAANESGGDDNITAILIRYRREQSSTGAPGA